MILNLDIIKSSLYRIHYHNIMYQIHLKFKNSSQKITVSKNLSAQDLSKLISHSFAIKEKIVGFTDKHGKFFQLRQVLDDFSSFQKDTYFLVTAKDLNDDNMSFASEHYEKQNKNHRKQEQVQLLATGVSLPQHPQTNCLGIIGDLQLFQEMFLNEGSVTIVNCFSKVNPPLNTPYQYYLYHDKKNSSIVYVGSNKVCQFFVEDWAHPPQEIAIFIKGVSPGQQDYSNQKDIRVQSNKKQQQQSHQGIHENECNSQIQQSQKEIEDQKQLQIKQSFLQNLNRLFEEDEINELQYYKLKSQVLENPHDFMRKYQMGTRQGFRKENIYKEFQEFNRQGAKSKESRRREKLRHNAGSSQGTRMRGETPQGQFTRSINSPDRGRSQINRTKKYEIPIIVRKYNNVVEKISTSYPLSIQQEQDINLILELELKGLISEKEAGLYKSLILQEDPQVFKLFSSYFNEMIDQIELANKLRQRRKPITELADLQSRERVEHNMRLLIKHAKQNNYQLLRKLALQNNKHVISAIEGYRTDKNSQNFVQKLEKVANYYRAKEDLEEGLIQ